MAGHVDRGLSSHERSYRRGGCDLDIAVSCTGAGVSVARFFNKREGRIRRWLGAFDDRIVLRVFSMLFDFIDWAFVGIDGGHHFTCTKENTAG